MRLMGTVIVMCGNCAVHACLVLVSSASNQVAQSCSGSPTHSQLNTTQHDPHCSAYCCASAATAMQGLRHFQGQCLWQLKASPKHMCLCQGRPGQELEDRQWRPAELSITQWWLNQCRSELGSQMSIWGEMHTVCVQGDVCDVFPAEPAPHAAARPAYDIQQLIQSHVVFGPRYHRTKNQSTHTQPVWISMDSMNIQWKATS